MCVCVEASINHSIQNPSRSNQKIHQRGRPSVDDGKIYIMIFRLMVGFMVFRGHDQSQVAQDTVHTGSHSSIPLIVIAIVCFAMDQLRRMSDSHEYDIS